MRLERQVCRCVRACIRMSTCAFRCGCRCVRVRVCMHRGEEVDVQSHAVANARASMLGKNEREEGAEGKGERKQTRRSAKRKRNSAPVWLQRVRQRSLKPMRTARRLLFVSPEMDCCMVGICIAHAHTRTKHEETDAVKRAIRFLFQSHLIDLPCAFSSVSSVRCYRQQWCA